MRMTGSSLETPKDRPAPSEWSFKEKVGRVLWGAVQSTLFRYTFHNWYGLRAGMLRLFGAELGRDFRIRRTARIEVPWMLNIGDYVSIGDFAILYALGEIRIGHRTVVSQYAHLCAGTHDHTRSDFPLIKPPIVLGEDCWVAADAFVGPGVSVGDRSVVGARASVFRDVPPDVIVGGNPAKVLKPRHFRRVGQNHPDAGGNGEAESTVTRPVADSSMVEAPRAEPAEAAPGAGPADGERPAPAKAPVTVLVTTLNEAKNLPRCLDCLTWADEVVVVDSHSTDDTREIARRMGARVIDFQWNGQWPKKRNWILRNADLKHEWVLIVDADELIVPELAAEIVEAIKSEKYVGYYINRRFLFLNAWIKHCGYYPSWNLRLIKRGFGEYERLTDIGDTGSGDNEVHEHIVARGPVAYLTRDMLHYAFPNIYTFVEKHNRYSNWEAAVQYKMARNESTAVSNAELKHRRQMKNISRKMPFRATLRFLYHYIYRLGFLDGRPGFYFCRLLAMYEFLSVAKYYELKQMEKGPAESAWR